MSKVWFTSDKHHHHKNVLIYDNRPFKTIEEMDEKLIFNHNQMVKEDDICYDLGDIVLGGGKDYGKNNCGDIIKKYNGRYVLIKGNHDSKQKGLCDKITSASMYISGLNVFCVHDPMNSRVEYDLNLCGHVHNWFTEMELQEKGKKSIIINVGVTQWNYRPVGWEKIYAIYIRWKKGLITPEIFDKKALAQHRQNRKR